MRRLILALCVALSLAVSHPRAAQPAATPRAAASHAVPARLSDADFWRMVTRFSEGDGYFASDNLVSNEITFQWVIPRVQASWSAGQAYLGVGPDQNFTYLSALNPSIAFIVDIRRDNLRLQLLYKALMEMSPTRAAFLSRLLSRELPADLPTQASVTTLFAAFATAPASEKLFAETLAAVRTRLAVAHGFDLSPADLSHFEYVLSSFYFAGAGLTYGNTGRAGRYPSYQDLMTATDQAGKAHGYLASEANYGVVRDLQMRNLIVPVVGDFTGDKALRSVADYLTAKRAVVGVIYTSNVEQYLFQYGTWPAYYTNLGRMPIDDASTFIRSCFNSCSSVPWSRSAQLLDPVGLLLKDVAAGHVRSYYDLLTRSR
ncbi:MAG: hypothetical protein IT185_02500 [Acidobacteria bacterium]|nr:hypothetical protein [Acidobacteriota bacterium]